MRKQFSFKEFFTYAIRYWLITAICVVVGLGVAVLTAAIDSSEKVIHYEGQAEIAGVSVLYPGSTEKETANIYNTVCDNALLTMEDGRNKIALFASLSDEYCSITKQKSEEKGALAFLESLSVWRSGRSLKVAFTMKGKHRSADFCKKAVDEYLKMAVEKAKVEEPILQGDDKVSVLSAVEMPLEHEGLLSNILSRCVVGLLGGFAVGLLVVLIVYFADPRLASYRDIALVTGNRLLSVETGDTPDSVCPKIDSVMQDGKCLLVSGDAGSCEQVARLYGQYAASAKEGALTVLLSETNDNESSSLAAFLDGQSIDACVEKDGALSVLRGSRLLTLADAKKVQALTDRFGRVIICKPYAADGLTALFGKVADKVVFAFDYKKARLKRVYDLIAEIGEPQKAAGACIEHVSRGFVGSVAYIPDEEEDEF